MRELSPSHLCTRREDTHSHSVHPAAGGSTHTHSRAGQIPASHGQQGQTDTAQGFLAPTESKAQNPRWSPVCTAAHRSAVIYLCVLTYLRDVCCGNCDISSSLSEKRRILLTLTPSAVVTARGLASVSPGVLRPIPPWSLPIN